MTDNDNKKPLNFNAKGTEEENTLEWMAFRAQLMAKARKKNLHHTLKKGIGTDGKTAANDEDKANAWSLIITSISNIALAAELARIFSDEDKDTYDPHGAYNYLDSKFKGAKETDNTLIENTYEKYLKLIQSGFGHIPTEASVRDTFNDLGTCVARLRGTRREVTDDNLCVDLTKMTEKCHHEIHASVIDEIKALSPEDKKNIGKTEKAIHAGILSAIRRLERMQTTSDEDPKIKALMVQLAEQKVIIDELQAKSARTTPRTRAPRGPRGEAKKCDTCG